MGFYNRYLLPHLINLSMGSRMLEKHRKHTVARARGSVLELGFGSGINLTYYNPKLVERLYAVEPDAGLLKLAQKRIEQAPFKVTVLQMGAEQIELPDNSIDTVLSTWTLCTIPDVEAALAQARRVLKPEGQLIFVEHGLAPEARVAGWQHRLTPYWKRCAGGCHLDRQADVLLRSAGFELQDLDTGYLGRPKALLFMYEGMAKPPAAG